MKTLSILLMSLATILLFVAQTNAIGDWLLPQQSNKDYSLLTKRALFTDDKDADDNDSDMEGGIKTIKEMPPIDQFPDSDMGDHTDENEHQKQHMNQQMNPHQQSGRQEHDLRPLDPRYQQQQNSKSASPYGYPGQEQEHQRCAERQYMCRKVSPQQEHIRCIPNEWKCNGVKECEMNDDEEGCGPDKSPATYPGQQHPYSPYEQQGRSHDQQQQCQPGQFTCYGSGIHGTPAKCLDRSQVCNSISDCPYGDDERNCPREGMDGQRHPHQQQAGQYDPRSRYPSTHAHQQPPHGQAGYPPPQQGQSPPEPDQKKIICFGDSTSEQHHSRPGGGPSSDDSCRGGRSEEYIKRLEFSDRCHRSCMKMQMQSNYNRT